MRRNERATPRFFDRVVTENEIRPKIRFLLSDEAKAEGKQMVRYLGSYTLSRLPEDTRCQFESLVRGIQEGRFPNIAAADEIMEGVLTESLQKIADGFRQPETMLWYQSWANYLEKGRPDMMHGAAVRMMTRDERWLPRIVDDETDSLPTTTVDAVYAGGGANLRRRDWKRSQIVDSRTEEQKARDAAYDEHRRIQDYAKSMIAELERVTRERVEGVKRRWTTKDEVNALLRSHFRSCGYEEELNLRWLRLGAY
jgi:hypothetical protein